MLFRKGEGKAIKLNINCEGILSHCPSLGRFDIIVKDTLPFDEQLKVIIHELLHISWEYEGIVEDGDADFFRKNGYFPWSSELEERIEQETERIYNNQPHLVNHLKSYLIDS